MMTRTLPAAGGDPGARLVPALRCLEHWGHHLRALSGPHLVPDPRQPGAPGHDDPHPGRAAPPPGASVEDSVLPVFWSSCLGLGCPCSQIRQPALQAPASVQTARTSNPGGAGGVSDARLGGSDARLRPRPEDEPQGGPQAPLLRQALSLPEAGGSLKTYPAPPDLV